jgi:hypothetical protein
MNFQRDYRINGTRAVGSTGGHGLHLGMQRSLCADTHGQHRWATAFVSSRRPDVDRYSWIRVLLYHCQLCDFGHTELFFICKTPNYVVAMKIKADICKIFNIVLNKGLVT